MTIWTLLYKQMTEGRYSQFQLSIMFSCTGKVVSFLNLKLMVRPPGCHTDMPSPSSLKPELFTTKQQKPLFLTHPQSLLRSRHHRPLTHLTNSSSWPHPSAYQASLQLPRHLLLPCFHESLRHRILPFQTTVPSIRRYPIKDPMTTRSKSWHTPLRDLVQLPSFQTLLAPCITMHLTTPHIITALNIHIVNQKSTHSNSGFIHKRKHCPPSVTPLPQCYDETTRPP